MTNEHIIQIGSKKVYKKKVGTMPNGNIIANPIDVHNLIAVLIKKGIITEQDVIAEIDS